MGVGDAGGGVEKDAGVMPGGIQMEVPDDFFRRVVEVAMDEGEEPEARYEDQPSLGALEYGDHPQAGLPDPLPPPDPSRYPFPSRRPMRTVKKIAARKTAIPAYCPGVSPKYLASPMRRKSRKKRAGT